MRKVPAGRSMRQCATALMREPRTESAPQCRPPKGRSTALEPLTRTAPAWETATWVKRKHTEGGRIHPYADGPQPLGGPRFGPPCRRSPSFHGTDMMGVGISSRADRPIRIGARDWPQSEPTGFGQRHQRPPMQAVRRAAVRVRPHNGGHVSSAEDYHVMPEDAAHRPCWAA